MANQVGSDSESDPTKNLRAAKDEAESSTAAGARGGYTKRPFNYERESTFEKDISAGTINIDRITDPDERRKIIDRWATGISLTIQSNIDVYQTADIVLLLAECKSEGIVRSLIRNTNWNRNLSGKDTLEKILDWLYLIFLGIADKEAEFRKEEEQARQRLIKMQLCNICSFKEFTCEFEKNLYKLPLIEHPEIIQKYLSKLPIIGEQSLEEFRKVRTEHTIYSFGLAVSIAEKQIKQICDLTKKQKQLKKFNKTCCTKIVDKVNTFGCTHTPNKVSTGSVISNVAERKIQDYCSSQKVLLVGEGDFSFSKCLAKAFKSATNMVATSLNSEEYLRKYYEKAMSNISKLRVRGCLVLHEVDATDVANHGTIKGLKFDRIIYNFPHCGDFRDSDTVLRKHQRLVRLFMKNSAELITKDGEIHIRHKCSKFFRRWDLSELASQVGLRLKQETPFNACVFPGYTPKYGFNSDRDFDYHPSRTYKFILQ